MRHVGLLDRVAEFVPSNIGRFQPRDTVGVAVALGRLREPDEATLLALAGRAAQELRRHSLGELTAVATALARVRVRDLGLLEGIFWRCADVGSAWELKARTCVCVWGGQIAGGSPKAASYAEERSGRGSFISLHAHTPTGLRKPGSDPRHFATGAVYPAAG